MSSFDELLKIFRNPPIDYPDVLSSILIFLPLPIFYLYTGGLRLDDLTN